MSNKERKKEISKQPIPTIEECLGFYKELTNLADVRFVPYYKMAIEALEKEPVLDKIKAEIKGWQDDIHDNENDADEHDFVFERIYEIFDEYKKESEDKNE